MQIREIMSKPVRSCRASDTLSTAAKLMWDHDCGAIPITGDAGELVGIVTDRDICMATYTKGLAPHAIAVADAMARQVFACHADETVEVAERLMRDKQVHRVPIVDRDAKLVGLLSLSDVARLAVGAGKRDGVQRELAETLADVCRPRSHAILLAPSSYLQRHLPPAP